MRVGGKAFYKKLRRAVVTKENNEAFIHCASCIPDKIPRGMSPEEFGSYEVASNRIDVEEHHVNVISIWCKHCGKLVWSSKHLKHAY